MKPDTLTEFMTFLTSSSHSHAISFPEFRDFLLLLPREASPAEIFRYYEVKKFMGDEGEAVFEGGVGEPDIRRYNGKDEHCCEQIICGLPPRDDALSAAEMHRCQNGHTFAPK